MLLRDSGICNYNSKCWVSNTGSRFIGFLDTLPWLIWRERYMNCNTWAISVYDWTCNKLSKNLGLWSSKNPFFCDVACLRTTRHIYCVQLCLSWHPLPLSLTICTLTLVFLPLTWYTLAVAQHFKTTSKKKKRVKTWWLFFVRHAQDIIENTFFTPFLLSILSPAAVRIQGSEVELSRSKVWINDGAFIPWETPG